MSTPPPPSNDPFGTPDPEQIARNEAQRRAREEQAARDYAEYARQQQAAQHGAFPQDPSQQQWGQQQWSSQGWQGQNQPPGSPYPNQPAYPTYPGQPAYPAHAGYGYPTQPPAPGTATAALIFGIISFVILPPLGIVALILGIRANKKIKRTGSAGKGPAIAGTVMGSISTAITVFAIVAIIIIVNIAKPVSVNVAEAKLIDTRRAQIGHCLEVLPETQDDLQYALVPCDEPHVAEIVNIRSSYVYPETETTTNAEVLRCVERSYGVMSSLRPMGMENFDAFGVLPTYQEWDTDLIADMHCLVTPKTGKLKGSITDGTAELVP